MILQECTQPDTDSLSRQVIPVRRKQVIPRRRCRGEIFAASLITMRIGIPHFWAIVLGRVTYKLHKMVPLYIPSLARIVQRTGLIWIILHKGVRYRRSYRGRDNAPFIRSITHAPDHTVKRSRLLHCRVNLAARSHRGVWLSSERFSSGFAGRRPQITVKEVCNLSKRGFCRFVGAGVAMLGGLLPFCQRSDQDWAR